MMRHSPTKTAKLARVFGHTRAQVMTHNTHWSGDLRGGFPFVANVAVVPFLKQPFFEAAVGWHVACWWWAHDLPAANDAADMASGGSHGEAMGVRRSAVRGGN